MGLEDVLSDDKPQEKAPPAEEPKGEPAAPAEAKDTPKEKDPLFDYDSRRHKHQRQEWTAQGRDPETGQFLPKTEAKPEEKKPEAKPEAKSEAKPEAAAATAATPPAPPKEEMTAKEKAAFAAAADERRKRQALEQELAKFRAQPAKPEEKKSFWDDPEGHLKASQENAAAIERRAVLRTAELIARGKYTDFDEKVEKFSEMAKTTPGLLHAWLASPDPAEYAYRAAKSHMELEAAGGLEARLEQVRKETEAKVRAEVEANLKAKQEALERERAALVPSLSDVRGAASHKTQPVYSGPTPLNEIVGWKP